MPASCCRRLASSSCCSSAGAAISFQIAQLAGYAWISGHAIGQRPVTLWGTIGAVTDKLRLLVLLGGRMFARVVLLALPFLAIIAIVWFTTLAGRDVNYYLSENPPEWRRALLAAGIAGAGFAFVLLAQFARWIFAMPIAMFHALKPADVLLASERMLEGRLLQSITPLLLWWLCLASLAALCLRVGRYLTEFAMSWAGVDPQRVLPLVALFMAVTIAFSFVYATLQFAGHQFLATRMYAERRAAPILLQAPAGLCRRCDGCARGSTAPARRAGRRGAGRTRHDFPAATPGRARGRRRDGPSGRLDAGAGEFAGRVPRGV